LIRKMVSAGVLGRTVATLSTTDTLSPVMDEELVQLHHAGLTPHRICR
jgi:hypothetical protein